jgi:hypothetical protein
MISSAETAGIRGGWEISFGSFLFHDLIFSSQDKTPKPALFRWALTFLGIRSPSAIKNHALLTNYRHSAGKL